MHKIYENTSALQELIEIADTLPEASDGATFDIVVTVEDGATVNATQGGTVVTGISDGGCTLNVNKAGEWMIEAISSNNEQSDIQVIVIDDTFDTTLTFWRAYIEVDTIVGAVVTCVNGSNTYSKTASSEIITFTVNDPGTWTITATLNGETDTTQVNVYSQALYKANVLKPLIVDTVLNNNDWATIGKVSDADQGANYWAVGDAKQVILNGTISSSTFQNLELWPFILGFNHNSSVEGEHRIHFQLGRNTQVEGKKICLVDDSYNSASYSMENFVMNAMIEPPTTNLGGWESCFMRSVVLGSDNTPISPTSNSYIASLPRELREIMKSVTKYSDNAGGNTDTASNVTATTDYLPLPAEFEILGERIYANSAEQNYQMQYDYYKNGNSKVFYKYNDTTSEANWWLRSVAVSSSLGHSFRAMDNSSTYSEYPHYSLGIAPIFCV